MSVLTLFRTKLLGLNRLIEICSTILLRFAAELGHEHKDVLARSFVPSLIPALGDTFPEGKRAVVSAISNACLSCPWSVHAHFMELAKGLVSNLTHQHVSFHTAHQTRLRLRTKEYRQKLAQSYLMLLWMLPNSADKVMKCNLNDV